jgi:hypothetical protein
MEQPPTTGRSALAMSSIIPFTLARRATTSRRALERLTAAYARAHHERVSPLVGCYLCLHSAPRRPRELAAAA